MSNHTPKPWVVAMVAGKPHIQQANGEPVDLTLANAHLACAGPDYYDAAEAIRAHVVAADRVDRGDPCTLPPELVRALLDAHNKAEGRA